jgi:gamma-F420-2:alpha-L-glutamate ligase
MTLAAVWGLETADYGWLPSFPPARRLAEACENRGHALRFFFPRDAARSLAAPPSVARSPDDPLPPGPCLIRGAVDLALVRDLEAAGWRCVNPSRAIEVATDKLETQRLLDALGIPTPRAWLASDPTRPRATAARPLVAKPRFGSRGAGVRLVRGEEEIAAIVGGDHAIPADRLLLQDFVSASQGRDLRAFFASDRVVAVAERRGPPGALVSNPARGGQSLVPGFGPRLPAEWEDVVLRVARAAGLSYGTVDFLYAGESDAHGAPGDGLELTVCEVNAMPGFTALEEATGIDVADAIVSSALD